MQHSQLGRVISVVSVDDMVNRRSSLPLGVSSSALIQVRLLGMPLPLRNGLPTSEGQPHFVLPEIGILYQQMTGVGNELLCALQGFRAKTWYMMQQQVRPFCGECHRHVLVEWLYKKRRHPAFFWLLAN